jgi:predicted RecA/RadA family phage recombinase
MGQADFKHGTPRMLDHTPGSAVNGGDVVVVGDRPLIAHRNIAAGELGALAAGGGVYQCVAGEAIAAGKKVWWNDTTNKLVETSTGNKAFGYLADDSSAAADGDLVLAHHVPEAG